MTGPIYPLWHLLDDQGRVQRSVSAPDKWTAQQRLGPGPVVSAASYSLDRTWTPPKIYDAEQKPTKRTTKVWTVIPPRHLSTPEFASLLKVSEDRVRFYARTLRLEPLRIMGGKPKRIRFYWSPEAMEQMRDLDLEQPLYGQRPEAIERRRQAFLRTMAKRYAERRIQRQAERKRQRKESSR
jgi:hypothetical protein